MKQPSPSDEISTVILQRFHFQRAGGSTLTELHHEKMNHWLKDARCHILSNHQGADVSCGDSGEIDAPRVGANVVKHCNGYGRCTSKPRGKLELNKKKVPRLCSSLDWLVDHI